jgi:hypothetical protein
MELLMQIVINNTNEYREQISNLFRLLSKPQCQTHTLMSTRFGIVA